MKLSKGKMYLKVQIATCSWTVKPIQMRKTENSFRFYLSSLWDAGEAVERIAGDFKKFLMY